MPNIGYASWSGDFGNIGGSMANVMLAAPEMAMQRARLAQSAYLLPYERARLIGQAGAQQALAQSVYPAHAELYKAQAENWKAKTAEQTQETGAAGALGKALARARFEVENTGQTSMDALDEVMQGVMKQPKEIRVKLFQQVAASLNPQLQDPQSQLSLGLGKNVPLEHVPQGGMLLDRFTSGGPSIVAEAGANVPAGGTRMSAYLPGQTPTLTTVPSAQAKLGASQDVAQANRYLDMMRKKAETANLTEEEQQNVALANQVVQRFYSSITSQPLKLGTNTMAGALAPQASTNDFNVSTNFPSSGKTNPESVGTNVEQRMSRVIVPREGSMSGTNPPTTLQSHGPPGQLPAKDGQWHPYKTMQIRWNGQAWETK